MTVENCEARDLQRRDLVSSIEPSEVGNLGNGSRLGLKGSRRLCGDSSVDLSDVVRRDVLGVAIFVRVADGIGTCTGRGGRMTRSRGLAGRGLARRSATLRSKCSNRFGRRSGSGLG